MEVDDVVMRIGDDEKSTGWFFVLTTCVLLWVQQVVSSRTEEVTNFWAPRSLQI